VNAQLAMGKGRYRLFIHHSAGQAIRYLAAALDASPGTDELSKRLADVIATVKTC
jgi:hypothetical protein